MKRKVLYSFNRKLLSLFVSVGIYISILVWTHAAFQHNKNVNEKKGMLQENHISETSTGISKVFKIASKVIVNSSQHELLGKNTSLDKRTENSDKTPLYKGLFCTIKSNWNSRYISKTIKSNMSSWTYKKETQCLKLNITKQILDIQPKLTFSMQCEGTQITFTGKKIPSNKVVNNNVFRVNFGDRCLATYINSCCKDTLPIPNVVHYVRYGKGKLTFFEFVSFVSVIRFVRPCMILIHGDALPTGKYWNFIVTLSPNIVHVNRDAPKTIFGKRPVYKAHAGDIMRIEALLLYGGIYLDTDTVIVKSLTPLMKYPCTMSVQSTGCISSAFIMAEQNATFLHKWLDGYKYEYKVANYIYNAMVYPRLLSNKFKELIHVDNGTISRPWKQTGNKIYTSNYNWKGIYGIHLFIRNVLNSYKMNEETVKRSNSTFGSICRHILYGNKELCK